MQIWKIKKKIEKNISIFEYLVWIVCIELYLLRRKYLSAAVYVWIKNFKTLHVTKSDFFQLNFLDSDQSIW